MSVPKPTNADVSGSKKSNRNNGVDKVGASSGSSKSKSLSPVPKTILKLSSNVTNPGATSTQSAMQSQTPTNFAGKVDVKSNFASRIPIPTSQKTSSPISSRAPNKLLPAKQATVKKATRVVFAPTTKDNQPRKKITKPVTKLKVKKNVVTRVKPETKEISHKLKVAPQGTAAEKQAIALEKIAKQFMRDPGQNSSNGVESNLPGETQQIQTKVQTPKNATVPTTNIPVPAKSPIGIKKTDVNTPTTTIITTNGHVTPIFPADKKLSKNMKKLISGGNSTPIYTSPTRGSPTRGSPTRGVSGRNFSKTGQPQVKDHTDWPIESNIPIPLSIPPIRVVAPIPLTPKNAPYSAVMTYERVYNQHSNFTGPFSDEEMNTFQITSSDRDLGTGFKNIMTDDDDKDKNNDNSNNNTNNDKDKENEGQKQSEKDDNKNSGNNDDDAPSSSKPPNKKRKLNEDNSAAAKTNSEAVAAAGPSTSTEPATQEEKDKEEDKDAKKKKNRCAACRKKVGLTGFECRCGGLFCAVHRYSDKHDCTFNYREHGAQEIRRNNPVVVGEKIQKI